MINSSFAQVIDGQIKTSEGEVLVGASIVEAGTQNGVVTDVGGRFSFTVSKIPTQLIASFIGFKSDTLLVKDAGFLTVTLTEETEVIGEVVIESSSTFFDPINPIMSEVLTEKELEKAACCNLAESFETNASVDVSITDAVSGGKVLRVLGLDGRYVQLNRENLPNVRGLIGRYGLGFISGTWIQSIDVGKGTGSVTTGYESMTGHINLEFKKPKAPESLYVNSYVNNFGRSELNVNKTFDLSEAWSTAILFHADNFSGEIDRNEDGFMDLPKSRQLNLLNRYGYSKGRWISQLGLHLMTDEKSGGQLGFG
ncbi:MAG: carboxypeptidase-like regulatory domain-containing protein, partial [Bacteroidota bacterium]